MKKIIIFIILSIFIFGCKTATQTSGNVIKDEDFIKIPLSDVNENVVKYSFDASGIEVRYFTVLGDDGEVRTAFDACDVCGGALGYTQQGSDIKCNSCGRVFSIDGLGTKNQGYGCWPSYLPHEVVGDTILIKKSDIEAGRHRFA